MSILIFGDQNIEQKKIELLAAQTGGTITGQMPKEALYLHLTADGLFLKQGELSMRAELDSMIPRLARNNLLSEMLVKAAKMKKTEGVLTAFDATAGMGEDSLLLAAAGFEVTLYEYNPVIAALLQDALLRAANNPALSDAAKRMHLICGDSIAAMRGLTEAPDIILLDPMFPKRQKSGLIKKKFQLLQQLECPCGNEEDLLSAALSLKPKKIIVKRPKKGPYLAGRKPSYSSEGKAIRYDVILP